MNNRTAKMIRRQVYGDMVTRNQYRYRRENTIRVTPTGRKYAVVTLVCQGLRREYQLAKKAYKRLKREGGRLWQGV